MRHILLCLALATVGASSANCAENSNSQNSESLRVSRPAANTNASTTPLWLRSVPKTNAAKGSAAKSNTKIPDYLNIPVMKVEEHQRAASTGGGLGLIGIYALCPDDKNPCYITNVFPTSDLNQFGVASGDMLLKVNGVSPFDYMSTVHPTKPGEVVDVTVDHSGISKTFSVRLNDMRTFTPYMGSYATWATSHIPFMATHRQQYQKCGLF